MARRRKLQQQLSTIPGQPPPPGQEIEELRGSGTHQTATDREASAAALHRWANGWAKWIADGLPPKARLVVLADWHIAIKRGRAEIFRADFRKNIVRPDFGVRKIVARLSLQRFDRRTQKELVSAVEATAAERLCDLILDGCSCDQNSDPFACPAGLRWGAALAKEGRQS